MAYNDAYSPIKFPRRPATFTVITGNLYNKSGYNYFSFVPFISNIVGK